MPTCFRAVGGEGPSWRPRVETEGGRSYTAGVACLVFLVVCLHSVIFVSSVEAANRPNVVIVITDDQGYGDLSCHGNQELPTPHLDALHADSVRLTHFHVDPTCAPTRAALMTGKYPRRVGVWHTVMGRSFLATEETTLAERFADAGYRTAIFGKWHLGDPYPLRPQDRGFQEVLIHGGGGVGQTPDFWGNDYFDDTYFRNGHPEAFKGYCTDVWFSEATKWLEENRGEPFFLYLATNAPHSPYLVDERYSRPFRDAGIASPRAEFYGMIVNIDENVGRLRARLEELRLAENTIFLFLTDNGTAAGHRDGGFNAGMRASKGSEYDGGHRVPCFIHWPAGGIVGGRNIGGLTAHVDLLPTLCALCGIGLDNADELDGIDLSPFLRGAGEPLGRTLFVESQRLEHPQKWRQCAVLTDRWRLVNGVELYDIEADPGQRRDIAGQHPDVVADLREAYERWWDHVSLRNEEYVRIVLGAEAAPLAELTCHDWHPPSGQTHDVPWSQQESVKKDPAANGFWAVEFAQPGRYEFRLRRRPASHPTPIASTKASVIIDETAATVDVDPEADAAILVLDLPAGPAKLLTELHGTDGQRRGAYYVEVKRIP